MADSRRIAVIGAVPPEPETQRAVPFETQLGIIGPDSYEFPGPGEIALEGDAPCRAFPVLAMVPLEGRRVYFQRRGNELHLDCAAFDAVEAEGLQPDAPAYP